MKRDFFLKIIFLMVIGMILTRSEKSMAIPAFARKYQISCQVCHSPAMPRLKGFGEDFATKGYRMDEYESPRYYIPTGDDRLSLFRELPLAIRIDGFASYNFNDKGGFDFGSPFVMKLLSAGELSDKLSYYFYFLLNERGSVVGIEDAFLMYRDLLKTGITFYVGQFQASDPLFKSETRLTLEPYQIYDSRPGNSMISLKYERGIILEKVFPTGTSLLAEVVNGNGIGEAGEGFVFDSDKHKNFLFRLSQNFGPKLLIGVFGYTGREDLAGGTGFFENDVLMFGPDVKLNLDDRFVLNLQYVRRFDSEVFIEGVVDRFKDVMTHGGFAELIFSPKGDMSKWYLAGLLNLIESDMEEVNYRSATFHAGYLVRRNVRAVAEFTQNFASQKYGKASVGFVTAF